MTNAPENNVPNPSADKADADERVFTYDEPDEDFCAHLMECYEWKTTGQRGVDWADKVAKYRLSHPMELEARPTLAETTGLITGDIKAGVKFSAAVQTLFPVGTSIEGDREIRDLLASRKARRSKPSRYLGGLWLCGPRRRFPCASPPTRLALPKAPSCPAGFPWTRSSA